VTGEVLGAAPNAGAGLNPLLVVPAPKLGVGLGVGNDGVVDPKPVDGVEPNPPPVCVPPKPVDGVEPNPPPPGALGNPPPPGAPARYSAPR